MNLGGGERGRDLRVLRFGGKWRKGGMMARAEAVTLFLSLLYT